jgi:hypothetical protein
LKGVLAVSLICVDSAGAAEISGGIQCDDAMHHEIVLHDGCRLVWDDDTKIAIAGKERKLGHLKEGAQVKAQTTI